MRKKLYLFVIFNLFLTACTAYIDSKREAGIAGNVGQSTEKMIAICYNPIFTNAQQHIQLAQNSCPNKQAVLKDTKYFNCTLFYPNTAFYECQ